MFPNNSKKKSLPEFRLNIAVIGQPGAGKSAFMHRLLHAKGKLPERHFHTVGVDQTFKKDPVVQVITQDTSSHTDDVAKDADLMIMVVDATQDIETIKKDITELTARYKDCNKRNPPFAVVFSQCDQLKMFYSKTDEIKKQIKLETLIGEQYCFYSAAKNKTSTGQKATDLLYSLIDSFIKTDKTLERANKDEHQLITIERNLRPEQRIGGSIKTALTHFKASEATALIELKKAIHSSKKTAKNSSAEELRQNNVAWLGYFIQRITKATPDATFNLAVLQKFMEDILNKEFTHGNVNGGDTPNTLLTGRSAFEFNTPTKICMSDVSKFVFKLDGKSSQVKEETADEIGTYVSKFISN